MEEGGSFTREALLQAEARLAAKRAARAEAREIRMKELERQQKEIYQVQKKYYGLDTKFGDIEQWMEDSERYSRRARRNTSASDEDERMSVGSRGSLRANGFDEGYYGSSQSRKSSRSSRNSDETRTKKMSSRRDNMPSDYSCYLSSGSRASSRASSARASPVLPNEDESASYLGGASNLGLRNGLIEERPEKDFIEKGNRSVSSLSATTLASLGGTSSRRGSGDTSISVDTEASLREIKDSLAEVEEKYKKAMVSNAQLDNDKATLMYQVDILKDALMEAEEQLAETRREYEEKCKENEKQKHSSSILQFQLNEVKETLKQRDELLTEIRQLQQKQQSSAREISDLQETIEWKDKKIGALERQKEYFDAIRSERDALRTELVRLKDKMKKHGIAVGSVVVTNGEASVNMNEIEVPEEVVPTSSQDVSHAQQEMNTEQLDVRLQKVADDRESLLQQIVKLKAQLEERQKVNKMKNAISEEEVLENGTDVHLTELQRDSNRQICELKFKLAKSEQEITALEQNVIRLEGQVTRYKSATENSEKVEDELKSEKRKLQRELRSALDKIEELEVSNSHLVKRLEKMKANRSALLSQQ